MAEAVAMSLWFEDRLGPARERARKRNPLKDRKPDACLTSSLAGDSWIYLAYDHAGRIVYVGLSDSPARRMGQHERNSLWWPTAARIDFYAFDTREEASRAEEALIILHQPSGNTRGIQWRQTA